MIFGTQNLRSYYVICACKVVNFWYLWHFIQLCVNPWLLWMHMQNVWHF